MLEVISWFLIMIMTYFADCYVFCKITNQKFKITKKVIVFITIAAIINCYFQYNYESELRMIITNLELLILLQALYEKSVVKNSLATLFISLGYAVSEIIFAFITGAIFKINIEIFQNGLASVLGNIIIIGLFIILYNNKLSNLVSKIISCYKDNKKVNTIFLIVLSFVSLYILIHPISAEISSYNKIATYIIFFIFVVVFVTGFFNQKSKNDELSIEYDHLLNYVTIYEKELNSKSKRQHEYKNQLIIIKDMVKNKKAKDYIENLINDESEDSNEKILNSLHNIPEGGLKGFIHFKLNNIKYDNMEIHVNVSSKLNKKNIWKNCNDNLKDVSKIIGVFLDNAIEALEKAEEKYFILDVDDEVDNIVFTFSNTYKSDIDFSKIEEVGYTTKGNDHGYGLTLVKDIVNKNKNLKTSKEINGKFFVQHLYIKK